MGLLDDVVGAAKGALLEGTEGGGGLRTGHAVDGTTGKTAAGEGDLRLQPGFNGARVGAGRDRFELDAGEGCRSDGGRAERRRTGDENDGGQKAKKEVTKDHGEKLGNGGSFLCGPRGVEGVRAEGELIFEPKLCL